MLMAKLNTTYTCFLGFLTSFLYINTAITLYNMKSFYFLYSYINCYMGAYLQNVLIGMDITTYENRKVAATGYNVSEIDTTDDILLNDGYFEVRVHYSSFLYYSLSSYF